MTNQIPWAFEPVSGFESLVAAGGLWTAFLAVLFGLVAHWIWEVLVAALKTGQMDFGTWIIVIARVGISLIIGLVIFAGIWKQLVNVDPAVRFFVAFTQGFSVDALVAPATKQGRKALPMAMAMAMLGLVVLGSLEQLL